MSAYVEVHNPEGIALSPLEADKATIGHLPSHDIALPHDRKVSRVHAALERLSSGWTIRDLGSTNGTYVNGKRIWGEVHLRPGDEIMVGKTRLIYRQVGGQPVAGPTLSDAGPPDLTRREREVLLALCSPALSGNVFTEPASIREIAEQLFVTEAAVKQHLLRLYDKFGIHGNGERRRVRLANEALRSGAVRVSDLGPGKAGP